jgi:hypothetical protein
MSTFLSDSVIGTGTQESFGIDSFEVIGPCIRRRRKHSLQTIYYEPSHKTSRCSLIPYIPEKSTPLKLALRVAGRSRGLLLMLLVRGLKVVELALVRGHCCTGLDDDFPQSGSFAVFLGDFRFATPYITPDACLRRRLRKLSFRCEVGLDFLKCFDLVVARGSAL